MKSKKVKSKLASNDPYQQRQFHLPSFEKRFEEWVKNTEEDVEYLVSGTKSYEEFKEELTGVKKKKKE